MSETREPKIEKRDLIRRLGNVRPCMDHFDEHFRGLRAKAPRAAREQETHGIHLLSAGPSDVLEALAALGRRSLSVMKPCATS